MDFVYRLRKILSPRQILTADETEICDDETKKQIPMSNLVPLIHLDSFFRRYLLKKKLISRQKLTLKVK